MSMSLSAIRKTVDDLEINVAVQALYLHLYDFDCSVSAHSSNNFTGCL